MKDEEKAVAVAVGVGILAIAVNAMKKPAEETDVEITSAQVEVI